VGAGSPSGGLHGKDDCSRQPVLVLSFLVTCLFGVNRRNARFECFRALSLVAMLMLDGRKSRVELEI
jgi:hypothetical protein